LWKRLQDYYSKRFFHVNYECWVNKQIQWFFKESGRISMTNIMPVQAESQHLKNSTTLIKMVELHEGAGCTPFKSNQTRLNLPSREG
jgi:hypothetical protein